MKKFKTNFVFLALSFSAGLSVVILFGCFFSLLSLLNCVTLYRSSYSVFDLISYFSVSLTNTILIAKYFNDWDKNHRF